MSKENPLWGSERIRGELVKLGIVVTNRSIRRYRWRRLRPADDQRWRTFLTNELRGIWAADLFVVQTVSYRILLSAHLEIQLSIDKRRSSTIHSWPAPCATWAEGGYSWT